MIDFLRGSLAHIQPDYVVLDVGGVGYRVFVANPYAFQKDMGELCTIYTHHQVREDAIQLYGFVSRDEQSLFRKLIEVTGIGPKVALGMLSGGRPEAVTAAIQQENIPFLMKLPGIGKKTAQRIILDLKDKLGGLPASSAHGEPLSLADLGIGPAAGAADGVWGEAKEGLLSLGYTEAEADRALAGVKSSGGQDQEWTVDALMKAALRMLFTG